jgi:hypothetical protein|tara:strand:+ start:397 stop:804 length:408 start_codon:yes stop_codon:yes gene_type:complete
MSGNNVVKRFGDGPTINTPPIPRLVNPRSESLFRLPATDEINVINAGIHEVYPTKQIVRKIRQENRLNYQMNPPAYKQEDDGAQFVNYAGGYFRAWYIDMGVVTYLPGMYDTESSAKEAARNAKATRTHNGGPAF